MTTADDIRRLADSLRAIATVGDYWSKDEPYHRGRYEQIRHVAAELFALADTRGAGEIERTVFRELTHIAPIPVVDAAIVDDEGRLLLIQRADDGLWAMPGGSIDMGETPAQGAVREVLEETGLLVEAEGLIGMWDSRLCGATSPLQLYMFVVRCRMTGVGVASHAHEVLDQAWFGRDELPPLSASHDTRIPLVFEVLDGAPPFVDL
jgi:8-oxo-dGTP pyrophosphatase MutT (NUDIX family)